MSARDNGAPPADAAALYPGTVMHQRMRPRAHRFSYRVFTMLIDLDRLGEVARQSALVSVNRFNLVSFHEKDHGPRDGTGLRANVDLLLAREGLTRPERVLLLAYPRLLGYGFNPLSVYYAYDAAGQIVALVYEVRNTFGGMHTYVEPVRHGQASDAGIRQDRKKAFYVSPFIGMEPDYRFRMLPPGRSVRVRILETDGDGPLLAASFAGEHQEMTTWSLLKACIRVPFLTMKVIGAIHFEAFRLWRKRVPISPRPANAAAGNSYRPQRPSVSEK